MSDEEWSEWRGRKGSARGCGGDIIDLDQYMRGARPPRPHDSDWPVPDECDTTACESETEASVSVPPRAAPLAPHKRHSHDSGLSDDSYRPRRRKHRRPSTASAPRTNAPPTPFRPARALREQGDHSSRLAQLRDQLGADGRGQSNRKALSQKPSRRSDESSELSSSSDATPRHRNDIKTYKIIMTKLDELNRMLCSRPPPRAPASSSESLSEEQPALVAPVRFSARHGKSRRASDLVTQKSVTQKSVRQRSVTQLSPLRTLELSISPHEARPRRRNVLLESVVKCEASSADTSSLSAKQSRSRQLDVLPQKRVNNRGSSPAQPEAPPAMGAGGTGASLRRSLCGRCRGLWRALTGRAPPLG